MLDYRRLLKLLCLFVLFARASVAKPTKAELKSEWWKNAAIYQIYPRTFQDSDANGIGDIKGITTRLPYLKETGITAIWLPPLYKPPSAHKVDFGYEVCNYTQLDPELGVSDVEKEFEVLISEAHKLGIKIILEFVPNHSSIEHEWFVKSAQYAQNNAFADYYVWRDGNTTHPPNNWVSHFNESAWTFHPGRNQYYLHQFAKDQPDLNLRTIKVKEEIEKALLHWLNKGVDGFLMDSVPFLVEDHLFRDEKPSEKPNVKPGDYEYLNHEFTSNLDQTYTIISEWRKLIDDFNQDHDEQYSRILITLSDTDIRSSVHYCDRDAQKGAHFTLNYQLLKRLAKTFEAQDIINIVEEWTNELSNNCYPNWILGSHTQHRVATKYGPEKVDGLNTLLALLPGIAITYNGEEIGQENGNVVKAQGKDPVAKAKPSEDEYQATTKDLGRTPFHWDDSTNAGFTNGKSPWLPVSQKYRTNNLKLQSDPFTESHYSVYKKLLGLRQLPDFRNAEVNLKAINKNVIALAKSDPDDKVLYISVINIGNQREIIDLSVFSTLNKYIKVVVADSASKKHNRVLSVNNIIMEAYESFVARVVPEKEEGDSDWWKHAVIYQIYPSSFKDSNNDGEGDLQGIISKLPYLKDIGVTAVWLSSIYKSSDVDRGYDIIDYKDIDQRYGTLGDFEELTDKAGELNIKLIMEFVPNHSSNKHEWFIKSEKNEDEFKDFYVWKNKILWFPPNNWVNLYGNPSWNCVTARGQCYLHRFLKEQPDLNYRNPRVVEEMTNVLKFWLDRGVAGFRISAAPYLFEHKDFRDEQKDEHGNLLDAYRSNQPETFEMIYKWRELVDDYAKENGGDARIIITEAYTDIKNTMKYYEDEDNKRQGSHFTLNFQFITKLKEHSNARDIVLSIKEWLAYMPVQHTANWVLGNHDHHRVASRFGSKNVDGFNMLTAMLPGVMITYNGEEIGQENGEVTWEQGKDPVACQAASNDFNSVSRDLARTPFHWNWSTNAGFNEGKETWLPVSKRHRIVNFARQSNSTGRSHFKVYKELLRLRQTAAISNGSLKIEALSDNVLICIRSLEERETYIMIFNVGSETEVINLQDILSDITPYVEAVVISSESVRQVGLFSSHNFIMVAHESVIVVPTNNIPTSTTSKPDENGDNGDATALTVSSTMFIACLLFLRL